MREQEIVSNPARTLTVLSVSPLAEDHLSLQAIVSHSTWSVLNADNVPHALALLQQHEISVVLCEGNLGPGTWIDMLECVRHLPHPPSLIVTSRLADDRLWAEALNLGAYDVLAKPFDSSEVFRSVKSGWRHWHNQTHMRAIAVKAMTAGS